MKIVPESHAGRSTPLTEGVPPGIYPYLGGSVSAEQLRSAVRDYGGAVVSGISGARLARKVSGVLLDPAQYLPQGDPDPEPLFDFQDWMKRQTSAEVPMILTDTPRIPSKNRPAIHEALGRWELLDTPTLVVLPIEPWWLKAGLEWLIEEVRAAGRPVALVLMAAYNGLDATGAVAGLLAFITAVRPVPVVLLRSDISAVGAVAHGASAGFVGWSASTRHGSKPMRSSGRDEDREHDKSPSAFVPVLHDYFKASRFPALARFPHADVLYCYARCCGRGGLRRIADLSEIDLIAAKNRANRHSMISADLVAENVLSANEPRDSWWDACKAGAIVAETLISEGINVSLSSWLRQWIAYGSPSHAPLTVG